MGPLTSCDIQQDTTTQLLEPGETLGQDVGWGTPAVAHLSDDESGVQRALPSSQAEDPPEIDPPPTTNKVLLLHKPGHTAMWFLFIHVFKPPVHKL